MNEKHLLPAGSRTPVLKALCASGHTAAELAREIGVSTSAVRKTLGRLQAEGLVRYTRIVSGVGKPAHEYEITADGQLRLSRAYLPLLDALMDELERTLPESAVEDIVRAACRSMVSPAPEGVLRDRVVSAVAMLNDLGASATVEDTPAGLSIGCTCCAVGAVVTRHPLTCKGMECLLETRIGTPVSEQCERSGRPQCRFAIG